VVHWDDEDDDADDDDSEVDYGGFNEEQLAFYLDTGVL
jgi:hypothetical protein